MKRIAIVVLASWLLALVAAARPLLLTIEHYPTPAVISNLACDAPSSTQLHCTVDTNKPTTVNIQYQIAPIGWLTSAAATTADGKAHEITVGGLAGGLNFYVRTKATDAEGTQSFSDYINVVTPSAASIPVLSGFAASAVGTTSATFTWTTDLSADSQVECGTSTGVYTLTSTLDASTVTSHSNQITGLSQGTTYYCRGISDAGSGAGNSGEVVVMTGTAGTLSPPVLADIISHPSQAEYLCIDADSDGACEDYRWYATMPRDTSGWTTVDIGTNPTKGTLNSAISSASGCTVIEWDGTLTASTGTTALIAGTKCIELAGSGASKAQIYLPTNVSSVGGTSCGGDTGTITACGSEGTGTAWNSGYARGSTIITVASTSGFQAWSQANPTQAGMFVSLEGDFKEADCPEWYQEQLSTDRDGSYAVHRVVSVDSGTQLTIWPPVKFDYDENDPSCANYTARPLTLPLLGIRNMEIYSQDADYDKTNLDTTCIPNSSNGRLDNPGECALNNRPFVHFGLAQGWITDSHLHDHINAMVRFRKSRDVAFYKNEVSNPQDDANFTPVQFNSQMLHISEGATDIAVLDNYAHDVQVFIKQEAGGSAIVAHNYCTNTFGGRDEKCHFYHGVFAKASLDEANDFRTLILDQWWGQNGPWNVLYRNLVHRSSFNHTLEGMTFETRNVSLPGTPAPQSAIIGNYSDHQFDSGGIAPYQYFGDTHTPDSIGFYNWSSGSAIWGGCSTCTLANNTTSATQPAAHAAATAPPTLFCFEDPANPMACEDRLWPVYWCQEGADFTDPHNSIGAFSATQGDLPAKRRANAQSCTLCDSVGGSGC